MLAFKVAIVVLTLVGTCFFAFLEMKLRPRLTGEALEQQHTLFKLRVVVSLKFALSAILLFEGLSFGMNR